MPHRRGTVLTLRHLAPIALLVAGCATGTYTPPTDDDGQNYKYTATIYKPYDDAWVSLVNYISSSSFGIENFEKASGLLTLTFGSGNPSEFVDCGNFSIQFPNPALSFSGPYVDYLEQRFQGRLDGKMNIFIHSVSPSTTEIRVTTRYVLAATAINPATNYVENMQWVFDSGGSGTYYTTNPTAGTTSERQCRPTYKAEQTILEGIEKLSQ